MTQDAGSVVSLVCPNRAFDYKGVELKPPVFGYTDPRTVDEALESASQLGEEAKFLAGGQSLMPMLNMRLARPTHLIDLNRINSLRGVNNNGAALTIGSMTRQFTLEMSGDVARDCPLLSLAIPHIGHRAIRYRGTLGGSIIHADPAAELPAVAMALDAVVEVAGPEGRRQIHASDLFVTWFTTSLAPAEIVTSVQIPKQPRSSGSSFLEVPRRHGDFAVAGVAVTLQVSNEGTFQRPRLVAFGTGSVPMRLIASEEALSGSANSPQVLDDVADQARDEVRTQNDIHASSDYRRWVVGVLARRAITEAAEAVGVSGGHRS